MFAQKLEIAEGGWVPRRGRVQRHVSFNHVECMELTGFVIQTVRTFNF